ncbi:MAG: hypothetical protein ACSHX7_12750, partial [Luteolibacter sp.]
MKPFLIILALILPAFSQEKQIIILPDPEEKPAPLFFSTAAEVTATTSRKETTSTQKLTFTIRQGIPETLTLGLTGSGEITSLTGENLRDWSVRIAKDKSRYLDIRPVIKDEKNPPKTLTIQLSTKHTHKGQSALLLTAPGDSTGFSSEISFTSAEGTDLRLTEATNLSPLESQSAARKFITTTKAFLKFTTTPTGSASNGLELLNTALAGTLSEDKKSIQFTLTATAKTKEGLRPAARQPKTNQPRNPRNPRPAPLVETPPEQSKPAQPTTPSDKPFTTLLTGNAALTSTPSTANYHIALTNNSTYQLIADTTGTFPVKIDFVVPVTSKGDWRQLTFALPAGVVVPVTLKNLPQNTTFDNALPIVPKKINNTFRGFLPASGQATLAWKNSTAAETGSLFYTSTATTELRIGSGLARQVTALDLRILQGKLPSLDLALSGPGEILSVTGSSVLAWSVTGEKNDRKIEVKLSRPIEGTERITIEAQTALGGFPVKMQALRITPLGSLRHSGHIRVANNGAVRIELAATKGLIQLTPEQFPGAKDESLRQVFVYRHPSADFSYQLLADQIFPEVGLTEVTVYELAETDRRIISGIELDIREAPLREWEMQIPADHAVASVTGAEVADYAVSSEAKDGLRTLKIIFRQPVINRQLISLRLEKNQAAEAAPWLLQPLAFPGTKSHRGYIGATATAGYRLTPGKTTGLAEIPVTFFPRKTSGLQQAFRIRETSWTSTLNAEALGQSIQADVFHLYSLKAGAAYGSVLINYFVVGAPATEWKISVPATIGNIDVTGQNVGRDWRREDDTVIVPLSRPILGAGTLLLTFEQPMPSSGGQLSPGEVHPLGVQAERGYIQIVSPLQVKFSAPENEGPLLKIDPTELPAEFRLLSSAPTLAAWQYTARDFTIGANVQWYEQGETVDQVVDFLKLSSQISRDGQWVTDARFFVKSKGRATLRAILPENTSLWEAQVNGTPVNARADGKETLIPLPSTTDPNQAVEITLRYGARSEKPSKPTLTAPALDAPLVIGEWTVTGDENRTLVPRGGTADLVRPVLAETGWQWLARHPLIILILLFIGATILFRSSLPRFIRYTTPAIFIILVLLLALKSASSTLHTSPTLEYAAPVVSAAQAVTVEIGNLTPWQARTGWSAWILLILGTTISIVGFIKKQLILKAAGLALVTASFLSIRGGTPLFFFILALIAVTTIPWSEIITSLKRTKPAAATALLLLALFFTQQSNAQDTKPAESIIQSWVVSENRLQATMEVTIRAQKGDRFLLLES